MLLFGNGSQSAGQFGVLRSHSAGVLVGAPELRDWDRILDGADWFHTTGITTSLSEAGATAFVDGLRAAKKRGCTSSLDLNYRGKLWKWGTGPHEKELARWTVLEALPCVGVLVANEQDADDMLGIRGKGSQVSNGKMEAAGYRDVARRIVERCPNISKVAITLRESVSATRSRWGAMLVDASSDYSTFAPMRDGEYSPHEITSIVDRVGTGDSFGRLSSSH